MEEKTKGLTPYEKWSKEIEAAIKRLKKFRENGVKITRRFLDERDAGEDQMKKLNLFHNHVSTLQSMLYGRLPRVEVTRRYADAEDDIARVAALILNRMLNNDVQENGSTYSDLLKSSLQDRLLPGLGTARVHYDAEFEIIEHEEAIEIDPGTGEPVVIEAYTEENLVWETAETRYVHWQDFLWGFGRCWSEITWVAFRSYLTKEEAEERFGKKKANRLSYKKQNPTGDKEEGIGVNDDFKDPWEKAEIWEIWDKESECVYWYSKGCQSILDKRKDPLGLRGFFPCPVPMLANCTTSMFVPKADFLIAQDLYNDIDRLQTRISNITKALKVVGVYDKNNDGLQRMLGEGMENQLIPVDNWAMFAEKGGIKGTIDWFPLEDVANTLSRLREQRDETIALLYQVTGLSDILRGNAQSGGQPASATEQALKAKFASVRVQFLQDEFARFASELLALRAEVIALHFEPESIVQQSNIEHSYDTDMVEQAVELIKNPETSQWRVEVKPESIAMVDYAQLKAERTEYLNALSTFLQSAQAVGKIEPEMGPVLMELMKWGLAGFKGSQEIEGIVDKAVQAMKEKLEQQKNQPQPPSPEEIKAKAEEQKAQMTMQREQMRTEAQQQKIQAEVQRDLQKLQGEMQKMAAQFQAELEVLRAKTSGEVTKEAVQAEFNILETQADAEAKIAVAEARPKGDSQ